ncbi:MAG: hypothetical protein ACUVS5_11560 [Anaerolineae bacterium]
MAERTFQVLTPASALHIGHQVLDSAVSTAYNGYGVRMDAQGELVLSNANDGAEGVLYDGLELVEFPTSQNIAAYRAGKPVTYVTGKFVALVGKDLTGGSVPSVGATLYAANGGTWATSGTKAVGRVIGTTAIQAAGGAQTCALVLFNL